MPKISGRPLPVAAGIAYRGFMADFDAQGLAMVDRIVAGHADQPGALLPILHGIQKELGYIPHEAVPHIAAGLNLSRAEVHGVISFYHYFRQHAPGRHVLQVCRAEACQAVGCEATEAHAKQQLGCDYHGTSSDGNFTLEAAYCLGNCAAGPSVMIDDKLYGRVTPERLDELLKQWEKLS
jgi:formate dehydrogenase subunit gamma